MCTSSRKKRKILNLTLSGLAFAIALHVLSSPPKLQEAMPAPLIIEGHLLQIDDESDEGSESRRPSMLERVSGIGKSAHMRGIVRFEVTPDIKVFWDRKPLAPQSVVHTSVGRHLLRLERDGSESFEQWIEVSARAPLTIQLGR